MISAFGDAYPNNSTFINASYKITSADSMAFMALSVMSSGSPGPAPTTVSRPLTPEGGIGLSL